MKFNFVRALTFLLFPLFLIFIKPVFSFENVHFSKEAGRILFLIQQGEHEQALKLYQIQFQGNGEHDFELLHRMGIGIVDYGYKQRDPESQLLALFGASVSANEEVYGILEESLNNSHPEIQLVGLSALAQFQNDRADQTLLRALGSNSLLIRYEAVRLLCKKKHLQAVSQAESFMYKVSKTAWEVFPPLFACVGDAHSTRVLQRLLNHPSQKVRLAAIVSIGQYERDDLLSQIRKQVSQHHFAIQEASAYTLGKLKDEASVPKLQQLMASQYPSVNAAASLALYQMGYENSIEVLENNAKKGDLYAIAAIGEINDHPQSLLDLLDSNKQLNQIRLNAALSLLNQHHNAGVEEIEAIILKDKKDIGFSSQKSPGGTFKIWKMTPSASQLFKEDREIYLKHVDFKETLLTKVREISESHFIRLAHLIFSQQQNELVPCTVQLLEDLGTASAVDCLKQYHQKLGAPLVRHYCNLALYRLQEPGPYRELLQQWVKNQSKTEFIRFEPFSLWKMGENSYTLTPEETSKLLIDSCEALARGRDTKGVETLIEVIATGHQKNRYALAGLLIRATQ